MNHALTNEFLHLSGFSLSTGTTETILALSGKMP